LDVSFACIYHFSVYRISITNLSVHHMIIPIELASIIGANFRKQCILCQIIVRSCQYFINSFCVLSLLLGARHVVRPFCIQPSIRQVISHQCLLPLARSNQTLLKSNPWPSQQNRPPHPHQPESPSKPSPSPLPSPKRPCYHSVAPPCTQQQEK